MIFPAQPRNQQMGHTSDAEKRELLRRTSSSSSSLRRSPMAKNRSKGIESTSSDGVHAVFSKGEKDSARRTNSASSSGSARTSTDGFSPTGRLSPTCVPLFMQDAYEPSVWAADSPAPVSVPVSLSVSLSVCSLTPLRQNSPTVNRIDFIHE